MLHGALCTCFCNDERREKIAHGLKDMGLSWSMAARVLFFNNRNTVAPKIQIN